MAAKKTTIRAKGKKPVTFRPGGLHQSLGVPAGQKIPAAKLAAAKQGKFGPTAQKQANLANMLAVGRKTAARNRSSAKGK